MSILHTAYIAVCNTCGKTLSDENGHPMTFSTNVAAIQAARAAGWAVNGKGDTDRCPDCREKTH